MKAGKTLFGLSVVGAIIIGVTSYGSLSITSDDFMNDNEIKFVKGINSLTGTTVRGVASLKPIKLFGDVEAVKPQPFHHKIQGAFKGFGKKISKVFNRNGVAPKADPNCAPAVIGQELDLSLSEVYSPKKFAAALTKAQFDGSLSASNGVIDSMDVRLPGNENISMNNVRMCGNMFTYEVAGENYSGVIFTTDNKSFMVSLTGGPFNETRLKFDVGAEEASPEVQEVAEVEQDQLAPQMQNMPVVAQPGFVGSPVGQPAFNANNYEQDPQAQMAQNQFAPQPANGEAFSADEVEAQAQSNGFNFAPPADAQM